MNRTLILALAAAGAVLLASCNTTAGLGQDVRKLGSKIENAADHHR